MLKKVITIMCASFCLISASISHSAEVKVMRSSNLIQKGEDCALISEVSAYYETPENSNETNSKSITLKQMIHDGWKIVYVKDFAKEFMFIFTKDK